MGNVECLNFHDKRRDGTNNSHVSFYTEDFHVAFTVVPDESRIRHQSCLTRNHVAEIAGCDGYVTGSNLMGNERGNDMPHFMVL